MFPISQNRADLNVNNVQTPFGLTKGPGQVDLLMPAASQDQAFDADSRSHVAPSTRTHEEV